MKTEKPTALELAKLAAILKPEIGKERESIRQAMTLLAMSELELKQVNDRADYLDDLIKEIYKADSDDWQLRIKEYPGDKYDVHQRLSQLVSTDAVRKSIYKDKNIGAESRKKFFTALVDYAFKRQIDPPPSRNRRDWPKEDFPMKGWEKHPSFGVQTKNAIAMYREDLSGDKVNLATARWAFEVRKLQLSESRRRIIPASLRERNRIKP
jgi:hypothetical protein